MRPVIRIVLTIGVCLAWSGAALAKSQTEELREQSVLIFGVLPSEAPNPDNPVTPAKVELGRMLYYDARLSKNHDVSCNTCHLLDAGGVDGKPTSTGHKGQVGGRNAPTSYNAALHVAQFWDGRAKDVEEQAKGPPLNPIEMAMADEAAVETVLRSIPGYGPLFQSAFPGESQPISYDNMARAIGAFERGLLTPSPFDAFLAGNDGALSDQQRRGLQAFMSKGCISCHAGPLVGGAIYQKLGLLHAYDDPDQGRHDVTKKDSDRQVFKVPSLRNADKTAPYFHSGKIETLPEAVRLMGYHQLGLDLSDAEVADLVAFIQSLNGTIDESYVARPELPASGPTTPAPDPS